MRRLAVVREAVIWALVLSALYLACATASSASTRAAGTGGGTFFVLANALFVGRFAGIFASFIAPTPPLSCQIVAGIFLRNVPWINTRVGVATRDASGIVRTVALGLILTRAGLALDAGDARRRIKDVGSLALVPSTMEMVTSAGMGIGVLGIPTATAFALGFLLCGISLAVVVPPAVRLKREGKGSTVCDLILCASSFDGIYCVVGFGICAGVVGGGGGASSAWRVPAQLAGGLFAGLAASRAISLSGIVTAPERASSASSDSAMIMSIVMLALFAAKELGMNGGGALACIVFCVSLASEWKSQGLENALKETSMFMNVLWNEFTAPLLFVIIGMSLDLTALDGAVAGKAIAIIFVGGIARALGVLLATQRIPSMNWSERAFLTMAWTPKATIQAALASVVLDQAKDVDEESDGQKLLQTALLCILITAPLGAWCIEYFAPRLLRPDDEMPVVVVEVLKSKEERKV
ncbi:hypothetical protein BE221DRAFT_208537 [Ostreococcus tauri]|uniref:Cation/H+ exchanger transmembrane domain-containing protein n=1 Tax=Ostreococcus tauri TaxID=70448 RepID=A0A1Y5I2K7_OSTTA|nr:hypothetical protein BE221DRAFT_208537 [Ostreococcus tauri]